MKKEYDLSKLRKQQNPYAKHLKKQITIRISSKTIDYFKKLADETGIPYQNLIDSYLSDCAEQKRTLHTSWE